METLKEMTRPLLRILLSPITVALIGVLIFVPLILAIVDSAGHLWVSRDLHEPMEVVEGMGVILIGWGVALEERHALREIFALTAHEEEAWQVTVDHICHSAGIGLLVFGLFAEMCVEIVRLPNHIINTDKVDHTVIWASLFFLVLSALILLQHVIALFGKSFQDSRSFVH